MLWLLLFLLPLLPLVLLLLLILLPLLLPLLHCASAFEKPEEVWVVIVQLVLEMARIHTPTHAYAQKRRSELTQK